MPQERCCICGRFKKDPETVKPWMKNGYYHGHGRASHGDELKEAST